MLFKHLYFYNSLSYLLSGYRLNIVNLRDTIKSMISKKVLIIGLGKFGTIKADVYTRLGCYVDALDIKGISSSSSVHNCYNSPDQIRLGYDVYEICVPTQRHVEYLSLLTINNPDVTVVCEKPLCSNYRDLAAGIATAGRNFNTNYVYSENYVASNAIKPILALIKEHSLVATKVVMEFSKDRRPDIEGGRFVDTDLEGFGIEIPHMLTFLEILGFQYSKITSTVTEDLVTENKTYLRQGNIKIRGFSEEGVSVEIYQSLDGQTNFKHSSLLVDPENKKPYRILYMEFEEGYEIFVQFEPVYTLERYIARIELHKDGTVIKSSQLKDAPLNQLAYLIASGQYKRYEYRQYLTFQHGAEIAGTLIGLQKHSLMQIL